MAYNRQPGYIDNLLAVRGLSSLGVLFVHCFKHKDTTLVKYEPLSFGSYLEHGWEFGESTRSLILSIWPDTAINFVLFFFVHSGYLIGKIFFQNRYSVDKEGVFRFYRARFLRIAPLLWFNLLICLALYVYSYPTLLSFLGDLFFLNNLTGVTINLVTWSLSFEMQYYLLAPFIFLLFKNVSRKTFFLVIAVATFFSLFLYFREQYKISPLLYYIFPFLFGFSINILIRLVKITKFPFSDTVAIFIGFFGGNIAFYYLLNSGESEYVAKMVLVIFAMFTIFILELPYSRKKNENTHYDKFEKYGTFRLLFLRFWTWTGLLSYGVYLWHQPVLMTQHIKIFIDQSVNPILPFLGNLQHQYQKVLVYHCIQLPVVLVLTFILSFVTFRLVELRYRPHLYNFKDSRFFSKYLQF